MRSGTGWIYDFLQKKTRPKPGFVFGGVENYLSSPTSNIVESMYESMAVRSSSKEIS